MEPLWHNHMTDQWFTKTHHKTWFTIVANGKEWDGGRLSNKFLLVIIWGYPSVGSFVRFHKYGGDAEVILCISQVEKSTQLDA